MGQNKLHSRLLRELVRVCTNVWSLSGHGDWEEPHFLDKVKCCTCLQERLKVQHSELQAAQPIFTLWGKAWMEYSWSKSLHRCRKWVRTNVITALEENHLPCESSQEMEQIVWKPSIAGGFQGSTE